MSACSSIQKHVAKTVSKCINKSLDDISKLLQDNDVSDHSKLAQSICDLIIDSMNLVPVSSKKPVDNSNPSLKRAFRTLSLLQGVDKSTISDLFDKSQSILDIDNINSQISVLKLTKEQSKEQEKNATKIEKLKSQLQALSNPVTPAKKTVEPVEPVAPVAPVKKTKSSKSSKKIVSKKPVVKHDLSDSDDDSFINLPDDSDSE